MGQVTPGDALSILLLLWGILLLGALIRLPFQLRRHQRPRLCLLLTALTLTLTFAYLEYDRSRFSVARWREAPPEGRHFMLKDFENRWSFLGMGEGHLLELLGAPDQRTRDESGNLVYEYELVRGQEKQTLALTLIDGYVMERETRWQ